MKINAVRFVLAGSCFLFQSLQALNCGFICSWKDLLLYGWLPTLEFYLNVVDPFPDIQGGKIKIPRAI